MDKEELQEKASEHFEQQKQLQEEAVAELGQAEGLGETDTVAFGDQQITVKAWIPGGISDTMAQFAEAEESGNMARLLNSLEDLAEALANLCLDEPFNQEAFWAEYWDQWGPEGLIKAFETVADPALEGMESRIEVDNMEEKREAMGNWQKRTGGQR